MLKNHQVVIFSCSLVIMEKGFWVPSLQSSNLSFSLFKEIVWLNVYATWIQHWHLFAYGLFFFGILTWLVLTREMPSEFQPCLMERKYIHYVILHQNDARQYSGYIHYQYLALTDWRWYSSFIPFAPRGLSSLTGWQCNHDLITCPLKPVITKASRQALPVRWQGG